MYSIFLIPVAKSTYGSKLTPMAGIHLASRCLSLFSKTLTKTIPTKSPNPSSGSVVWIQSCHN